MLRQYIRYEATGEACRFSEDTGSRGKRRIRTKFLYAFFLFIFICSITSAQRKWDFGVFGGTAYYMGDLNAADHFVAPSVAAGPIARYNFNPRNSLRMHAFYHGLSGNGFHFPSGGPQEFAAKFVDLALNLEFNWWPYVTANRKLNHSPYVFVGIGYGLNLTNIQDVTITTPFGVGYKANLGRWLSAGVELGPRKVWSDTLDGVENPGFMGAAAPFGNRDWYFFTGLFVTYKIFKFWESCPTYDD